MLETSEHTILGSRKVARVEKGEVIFFIENLRKKRKVRGILPKASMEPNNRRSHAYSCLSSSGSGPFDHLGRRCSFEALSYIE